MKTSAAAALAGVVRPSCVGWGYSGSWLSRLERERGKRPLIKRIITRLLMAAVVAATVAVAQPAARAHAPDGSPHDGRVIIEGCNERFAGVLGQEAPVRSLVPEAYELIRYPGTDRPLLWVSSIHCDNLSVDGTSSETTIAGVAAFIESPDGRGCMSELPLLGDVSGDAAAICNAYLLQYATTNAAHAAFLRAGTPDFSISLTDDLDFHDGEFDPLVAGVPFEFHAGPRAPFRLESDFVVRDRPLESSLLVSFWNDTKAGTIKLEMFLELEFGEASGTVRTEPGSELAELFGAATAEQAPGVSLFGAPHINYGVITKQLIDPVDNEERSVR